MAQTQLQLLGWVKCDFGVTAMTVTATTAGISRVTAATVVLRQAASIVQTHQGGVMVHGGSQA